MLSLLQHGLKTWILWMVHLEMVSFAGSAFSDVYNFPMFGVLMYEDSNGLTPYGSVTIVRTHVALCAAENVYQLSPDGAALIIRRKDNLRVLAGSDILKPISFYGPEQKVRLQEIYVGKQSKWLERLDEKAKDFEFFYDEKRIVMPSPGYTNIAGVSKNAFGHLQWDVAALIFSENLNWTAYVLPAPNSRWTLESIRNDWKVLFGKIDEAEKDPHKFEPCVVPGWSPIGNNDIIYHKVVYVRNKECEESICAEYPSTCLKYLIVNQHICFKSLSFADSCVLDQGAPVICKWHPTIIMGVLVKAFDCGTKSLPSVFTTWVTAMAFTGLTGEDPFQTVPGIDDEKFINP